MMTRKMFRTALAVVLVAGATTMVPALPAVQFGLSSGLGTLDDRPVGELSASATIRALPWLDLMTSATAVHTLERSYEDAGGQDYQAESGWAGLGARPFVSLGNRIELGFPLRSAAGVVQFRYERPYRDRLAWDEEIIDREQIAVYSAGMDLQYRTSDRWGLSLELGGRTSSPVRTVADFDSGALTSWYAHLGTTFTVGDGTQQ